MKVVIHAGFGSFSYALPNEAIDRYLEISGKSTLTRAELSDTESLKRNDPHLVQVIEELGEKSSDFRDRFQVIEIPDDVDFFIYDYDGYEWIVERHRTWEARERW